MINCIFYEEEKHEKRMHAYCFLKNILKKKL